MVVDIIAIERKLSSSECTKFITEVPYFFRYQYTSGKFCKWLLQLQKEGLDLKDDKLPKKYEDYIDRALKDAEDYEAEMESV